MVSYIVRRMLLVIPVLWLALTSAFFLMRLAPGDPAIAILGEYASEETLDAFREEMGLNDPVFVQYSRYLGGIVQGDFGRSLISGQPVSELVFFVLPHTLELVFGAVLLGTLLGIPLGIFTAIKRNTISDSLLRTLSLFGISTPGFFLGILLLILFAVKIRLFPVVGVGYFQDPIDNLRHVLLPSLALAIIMIAYLTRVTRSAVLNVLSEDYVKTARSKGLHELKVLYKYVLRSASIPIVSVLGMYTIVLIGSSVPVEIVFSRPGLGSMLVKAAIQRDYVLLQSLIAMYAGFVAIMNLLTDICYGFIDPRIRYD